MSEELSRVKSRQNKRNRAERTGGKNAEPGRPAASAAARKEAPGQTLSRSRKKNTAAPKAAVPKKTAGPKSASAPARSRRGSRSVTGAGEEETTPSRSVTHKSERVRLAKLFVNTLYVLFVVLLVFLVWWGVKGAPPLRTLW